ncbi:MAG: hypothetical protein ACE5JJ_03235 [Nitrospinota bacterium]
MYASVRRYKVDPGSVGELARRVNEGFVPIVGGVRGFVAYYVVSAGDGVVLSINIFEDQAGADESNRRAANWVKQNIASLLPTPPQIAAGEVIVHKAR